MLIATLVIIPCVIAGGFVRNYYFYLITRIITCAALPIMWINGHNYSIEFFDPASRKGVIVFNGNGKLESLFFS